MITVAARCHALPLDELYHLFQFHQRITESQFVCFSLSFPYFIFSLLPSNRTEWLVLRRTATSVFLYPHTDLPSNNHSHSLSLASASVVSFSATWSLQSPQGCTIPTRFSPSTMKLYAIVWSTAFLGPTNTWRLPFSSQSSCCFCSPPSESACSHSWVAFWSCCLLSFRTSLTQTATAGATLPQTASSCSPWYTRSSRRPWAARAASTTQP